MKGKKVIWGMAALALVLVLGVFLTGCSTMPDRSARKVAWADYTPAPKEYDYTVVGVIMIKYADILTDTITVNADLIEQAIAMGAHDVINVRVDLDYKKKNDPKILAVTALAIKYNNVAEVPAE